ncbi:hypothetical protein CRG98_019056 [Punica granatum]|uniref:Uncharacterized protein n=1 Tax=Punica granatum TaxID=22663 RepID=A0A2I0JXK0_PUNGR|nr:hypothetical protein CRG98_019056 [Punica granatum]
MVTKTTASRLPDGAPGTLDPRTNKRHPKTDFQFEVPVYPFHPSPESEPLGGFSAPSNVSILPTTSASRAITFIQALARSKSVTNIKSIPLGVEGTRANSCNRVEQPELAIFLPGVAAVFSGQLRCSSSIQSRGGRDHHGPVKVARFHGRKP